MSLALSATRCQPRFQIQIGHTTYGPRDEFTGMVYWFAAAFETKAMAQRYVDSFWESTYTLHGGAEEWDTRITDLHPERDPANWGPAEPARNAHGLTREQCEWMAASGRCCDCGDYGHTFCDTDLPF
jgi:hypothetical protein